MKKIWLDDQLEPYRSHTFFRDYPEEDPKDWLWFKTVKAVIDALEAGDVEAVHLDHNLEYSDAYRTGMDVLDYLLDAVKMSSRLPPKIWIHTNHPGNAKKMWQKVREIEQYGYALRAQQRNHDEQSKTPF